jgi:hypothetical protein
MNISLLRAGSSQIGSPLSVRMGCRVSPVTRRTKLATATFRIASIAFSVNAKSPLAVSAALLRSPALKLAPDDPSGFGVQIQVIEPDPPAVVKV